jgi:diguanylate cyclase (GGDEF)-like protein
MQKKRQKNHRRASRLVPKNPWHLVWISVVVAILLAVLINIFQSFIWPGHASRDLLITGPIDVILVSLIVIPIVVKLGLIGQQRMNDELRELALTDELTKIYNRRGFYFLAEHLIKIANRAKSGMYLMFTDLDDFKKVNDEFGHAEGDKALKAYARLLKENYRDSDIVARIGGDEFVLLPVGTSKDGLDVIKNRFYKVLARYNDTHDHPWTLSATIGIAYYDPESPCSIDELLRQADELLYGQKKR